jgi:hypothetical protein
LLRDNERIVMLLDDQRQEKELARILSEQKGCAAYLLSGRPDKAGAWAGLADWVMEEVIIKSECSNSAGRCIHGAEHVHEMEKARPPD